MHAVFIPDGAAFTVPSAGVVAQETWPGTADTVWDSNEYKLGTLENFKLAPTAESAMIKTGIPGGLVPKRVHEIGKDLKFTCDAAEISATVIGLIFGGWISTDLGAPLSTSTSFTPFKGEMIRHGILAFSAYRNDNVLFMSGNIYAAIKATNVEPMSGANTFKASLEIQGLWDTNNTISTPDEPA